MGESQLSNYVPGLALLASSSEEHIKSLDIQFKGMLRGIIIVVK